MTEKELLRKAVSVLYVPEYLLWKTEGLCGLCLKMHEAWFEEEDRVLQEEFAELLSRGEWFCSACKEATKPDAVHSRN